jgi:hypothetical protein
LQAQYVPVNLRRLQQGYAFDLSKKALQKRILYDGSFVEDETSFRGNLVVSPKFHLRDYLQSFADPYWYNEANVEVKNLEV